MHPYLHLIEEEAMSITADNIAEWQKEGAVWLRPGEGAEEFAAELRWNVQYVLKEPAIAERVIGNDGTEEVRAPEASPRLRSRRSVQNALRTRCRVRTQWGLREEALAPEADSGYTDLFLASDPGPRPRPHPRGSGWGLFASDFGSPIYVSFFSGAKVVLVWVGGLTGFGLAPNALLGAGGGPEAMACARKMERVSLTGGWLNVCQSCRSPV